MNHFPQTFLFRRVSSAVINQHYPHTSYCMFVDHHGNIIPIKTKQLNKHFFVVVPENERDRGNCGYQQMD